MEGKHIYQWVDKLAPFLTGEHTLEQITASLSEDRRRMVTGLIGGLVQKGFVKDVTDDRPHTLPERVTAEYRSEIAFVDYYQDSAAYRFQRFRESTVLLTGSGQILNALVHAALHAGFTRVRLAVTDDDEDIQQARFRDPDQSLTEIPEPVWADPGAALDGVDVVIHGTDRLMPGRARAINRACSERGVTLIQATVDADEAWVGPLVTGDGHEAGCGECARLRILGWPRPGEAEAFTDRPEIAPTGFLAGPTAAIVANQMVFEVFKRFTGAGPAETAGAVVRIDLETLASDNHRITSHPLCSVPPAAVETEPEFLARVAELAAGPAITDETFSTAAAACFDERTGLLGRLDEGDFGQVPLKVSRAEYAGAAPGEAAVAVATDFTEARLRATRRACELYAAGVARTDREVPGLDLVTGAAHRVRADGSGLASGLTWTEAVNRGLLARINRITLDGMGTAADSYPLVDQPDGRFRTMLEILGLKITVHDVTGVLGVPTLVACAGSVIVGSASGTDHAELIDRVLEQALGRHQAQTGEWSGDPAGSWDGTTAELVRRLDETGRRPVAVPLDHDPTLRRVLPYIVDVVLVEGR
ncbi:MAG TPA: TOMM precursor leader peptide-binding protein [Actinoplanes sp.]|nr:TOMM precursor leader peptide-binding protein [Actinoplanes sp.]